MCLRVSYKKNMKKKFFWASLKSLKKGVGSGVGSGSVSQRYGSADPDPHRNITDPQHFSFVYRLLSYLCNHLKSEAVSASSSSPRRSATDMRVILNSLAVRNIHSVNGCGSSLSKRMRVILTSQAVRNIHSVNGCGSSSLLKQ
jgi:hypothetical protein